MTLENLLKENGINIDSLSMAELREIKNAYKYARGNLKSGLPNRRPV